MRQDPGIARDADQHSPTDRATPYWRLWSACFLGFGAIGATMQVMPAYVHERFGADAITAGMTVTIGALATMFSRPVSGRYADQSGGRRVAMAGAILGLIGGIGHLVATSLPAWFLLGFFWVQAKAHCSLGPSAGSWHTPSNQGGAGPRAFWAIDVDGLASGPMLGTAILSIGSYRGVWIAASVIPLLTWVLVASTRPESRASPAGANPRRALIPRVAWVPGASGAFSSIGYGVIAAFLVPRFAALGFSGQHFALSVFGVAFMVVRLLGSGLADHFGARPVLLSAFLIESVGLAGIFAARTEYLAFASTAFAGAGLSLLIPSVTSLVMEAAEPRERTAALGAVTSAWDLGVAIGGPLGGLVAGCSDAGPFALGAVAALAAILPLAMVHR